MSTANVGDAVVNSPISTELKTLRRCAGPSVNCSKAQAGFSCVVHFALRFLQPWFDLLCGVRVQPATTRIFTVHKLDHVATSFFGRLDLVRICGGRTVTFCKMQGDDFEVLVTNADREQINFALQ